ncbi:hypothetical protein NUSPORA_03014 [Nucleospora cyclopteri]
MSLQFCNECNNILYPKYENGIYGMTCYRCNIITEANSNVVYKRQTKLPTPNKNVRYFLNDVTLPMLNKTCEKCSNNKCVSYVKKSQVKALDTYYVCTSCLYEWTDENPIIL